MDDDILQTVSENEIQVDSSSYVVVDAPITGISPEDILSSEPSVDGATLGDNSVVNEENLLSLDSVSDNDVSVLTVSENGTIDFPYSTDDFTTLLETVTDIYDDLTTMNLGVGSISVTLSLFFVFTVFKWCEQKIKSFRKGLVERK